jgi:fumarate reductase subunit C
MVLTSLLFCPLAGHAVFGCLPQLTTLREKSMKIGAKVVRHGRYVTFQLAEVVVPRNLFREILRLIDGL